MKKISIKYLQAICLMLLMLLPKQVFALSEHYYDDDFIIASIVIADPSGKALYSALGHACIRMQCPSEGLDFCFSYESENASKRSLSFLAGNLHMGMFAVPIDEYVSAYREDGRGVYEYQLNLPLEVRRELWRLLDEQLVQGAYLQYDYFTRGCAITSLHFIEKALGEKKIVYGPWDNRYTGTCREMAYLGARGYEWFRLITGIAGSEKCIDGEVRYSEKLEVPIDLVHALQNATIDGEPVLSNECHVLCEQTNVYHSSWFTPQLVAVILLLLAIVSCFIKYSFLDWIILGFQTLVAILITYLVAFSSLPLTDWNWLIIPYNILPIVAWHWRRYWTLPYAGLMVVWILVFCVWPNYVVHPAHFIFVVAWILVLLKNSNLTNYLPKSQK